MSLEEAERPDFPVPCSLESLPTQQAAFPTPTQENGTHPNSPFPPQTLLEIKLEKNIFLKLKQVEFSALNLNNPLYGVASCACDVGNNRFFIAQKRIQKRTFTRIRLTANGYGNP